MSQPNGDDVFSGSRRRNNAGKGEEAGSQGRRTERAKISAVDQKYSLLCGDIVNNLFKVFYQEYPSEELLGVGVSSSGTPTPHPLTIEAFQHLFSVTQKIEYLHYVGGERTVHFGNPFLWYTAEDLIQVALGYLLLSEGVGGSSSSTREADPAVLPYLAMVEERGEMEGVESPKAIRQRWQRKLKVHHLRTFGLLLLLCFYATQPAFDLPTPSEPETETKKENGASDHPSEENPLDQLLIRYPVTKIPISITLLNSLLDGVSKSSPSTDVEASPSSSLLSPLEQQVLLTLIQHKAFVSQPVEPLGAFKCAVLLLQIHEKSGQRLFHPDSSSLSSATAQRERADRRHQHQTRSEMEKEDMVQYYLEKHRQLPVGPNNDNLLAALAKYAESKKQHGL